MPLLIGGARYRAKKGKRGTFVNRVRKKSHMPIGAGNEGNVYSVDIEKKGKFGLRKIRMVRKEFRHLPHPYGGSLWNPMRQLHLIDRLRRWNREQKLGLRIPTFRVQLPRKKGEPPKLLRTHLNIIPKDELKGADLKAYGVDKERQESILTSLGFSTFDVFEPVREKDGRVVAILADPGLLSTQRVFYEW